MTTPPPGTPPRRHWEDRPEPGWQRFRFNQPYGRGLERLRREVLPRPDFDPAVLWQWGTMQGMAIIQVLRDAERLLGEAGQALVYEALRKVGHDIGAQLLAGVEVPADLSDAEVMSYVATVINRIAYASLEAPAIDSAERASFKILWCPHQDHYAAFDCRVQRYFVQGMLDAVKVALEERGRRCDWDVFFECTIPSGAATCDFVMLRRKDAEASRWREVTAALDRKALEIARRGT